MRKSQALTLRTASRLPPARQIRHAASRITFFDAQQFALILRTCLLGVVLLWPGTARDASRPAVEAANGIVVSTHRLASEAGIAMLQQGVMQSMRRSLSAMPKR